jgi:hypothetical protein
VWQEISILYRNTPLCHQELRVITVPCAFSSLLLLYLYASPLVVVVAEGCHDLLVQGPYSFLEAG